MQFLLKLFQAFYPVLSHPQSSSDNLLKQAESRNHSAVDHMHASAGGCKYLLLFLRRYKPKMVRTANVTHNELLDDQSLNG